MKCPVCHGSGEIAADYLTFTERRDSDKRRAALSSLNKLASGLALRDIAVLVVVADAFATPSAVRRKRKEAARATQTEERPGGEGLPGVVIVDDYQPYPDGEPE